MPLPHRTEFAVTAAPLVSVVVPVWNGERFLRESLDSILAQTHPAIEVLVMDDASTDTTAEIVASYGSRLRHHRQAETRGIYTNANDGIALAAGEYIAVFHADDVYRPEIVAREISWLESHPEAGAVFSSDAFIDSDGIEFGRLELPHEVAGERPLDYRTVLNALLTHKNRFLRCPSSMVRASVYRDLGGYRQDEFRNNSDLEMWLRVARHHPVGILEDHLFQYRRGHSSSSERYQHVRTDPERFFMIMDGALADGGRAVATPVALRAFEAHRTEDAIMRSVAHYILDQRRDARHLLAEVRTGVLLASPVVQRSRLLALLLGMRVLARLPRVPLLADAFRRRWHSGSQGPGSVGTRSPLART